MKADRKHLQKFISYFVTAALTLSFLAGCSVVDDGIHFIQEKLTQLEIGSPKEVETVSAGRYAYELLDDEEKDVYDQIYDCLTGHDEEVVISTRDVDTLIKAYDYMSADHGEIFWSTGYEYKVYKSDDYITGMVFAPKYTMTRSERDRIQQSIDETALAWISEAAACPDDYTKSRYVFEKLINEVDYVKDSPDNQNIISVFVNKQTVCQGYASAASYMFERLGIPSTIVTGFANDQLHAWNLLLLDGEYYYFDATWGNSSFLNGEDSAKITDYGFLNFTSEEMQNTHRISDVMPLPECVAIADSYFVREGLFFEVWDPEIVGQVIKSHYEGGEEVLSLKFADKNGYDEAFIYLIEKKNFTKCCPGATQIAYLTNDMNNVLTLHFI